MFTEMMTSGGGGGSIDEVQLLNRKTLTPNPYTYTLSKAYKGIIVVFTRTTDSAAGNPIIEVSDGVTTTSSVTIAKNSTVEVHLLNSPSGTLTINRTSGATGQNALLTIDFIGIS